MVPILSHSFSISIFDFLAVFPCCLFVLSVSTSTSSSHNLPPSSTSPLPCAIYCISHHSLYICLPWFFSLFLLPHLSANASSCCARRRWKQAANIAYLSPLGRIIPSITRRGNPLRSQYGVGVGWGGCSQDPLPAKPMSPSPRLIASTWPRCGRSLVQRWHASGTLLVTGPTPTLCNNNSEKKIVLNIALIHKLCIIHTTYGMKNNVTGDDLKNDLVDKWSTNCHSESSEV